MITHLDFYLDSCKYFLENFLVLFVVHSYVQHILGVIKFYFVCVYMHISTKHAKCLNKCLDVTQLSVARFCQWQEEKETSFSSILSFKVIVKIHWITT
jgi:hypothetical protein